MSRVIKAESVRGAGAPRQVARDGGRPGEFAPHLPADPLARGPRARPGARSPRARTPVAPTPFGPLGVEAGADAAPAAGQEGSPGAAARTQARTTLEEARREAQRLAAAARRQGYEAGRREGLAAARTEAAQLLDAAQELMTQARQERQAMLHAVEADIARLALEVARKVVSDAIAEDPAAVVPVVRAAVERLAEQDELVIRVNPRDAVLVEEQRPSWLAGIRAKKVVRVIEDSSVGPGGCVVESEHGTVDARTDRQLERIEHALEEVIRSARA